METFSIPIDPLPCPRPRIATRGKFAHAYYPKSYKDWKDNAVELIAKQRKSSDTLTGPLHLTLYIFVTRPRTSKLPHPKPDLDNYAKSVMDALTQSSVWEDDSQVVRLEVTKAWTAGAGEVVVSIALPT